MASSALEKVQKLLEKYGEVVEEGRVSKYNEEMTKKDFILPLFNALGWKTADSARSRIMTVYSTIRLEKEKKPA
jgi:hypothetical protein